MCNYTDGVGRWENGVESEVKGRKGRDEHAKKKSHKGRDERRKRMEREGEGNIQRGRNGGQ